MPDKKEESTLDKAVRWVQEIAAGASAPAPTKRSNDVQRGVATYQREEGPGAVQNAAKALRERKKRDEY